MRIMKSCMPLFCRRVDDCPNKLSIEANTTAALKFDLSWTLSHAKYMESDAMVCVVAREAVARHDKALTKSDHKLGSLWLKWRTGQYFKYSHG